MRILVTGSRNWTDYNKVKEALAYHTVDAEDPVTLVHGGASGADTMAAVAAVLDGMNVEIHHALWRLYGKKAGPMRNKEMVDAGADVCLAFPTEDSIGTRHCMGLAEQAGIPVYNYGTEK